MTCISALYSLEGRKVYIQVPFAIAQGEVPPLLVSGWEEAGMDDCRLSGRPQPEPLPKLDVRVDESALTPYASVTLP